MEVDSGDEEDVDKEIEAEILALESDINFQTTLTLPSLNKDNVDSILYQLSFPPQSNNTYRILVTLKLAHLIPSHHIDTNTATMLHPQIQIQATRLEMTLNEVLVMACEYWHISSNTELLLLSEHGVWRPLTHRVVEVESSAASVVLLFLDQKPINILQEVRVALKRGSPLLQNEPARETAPLFEINNEREVVMRPKRKQKFLRTNTSSQQQQGEHWMLTMRHIVKTHVRNLRDPFVFNTRRWVVEFILSVGLVAVLFMYLVDALPRYSASSSQLFAHAEEELREADYNLVAWLQRSPSLREFFSNDLYGFGQSLLVGDKVKLAQNRVKLSSNDYLAPSYTMRNEQTTEYWQSTKFTNTNESFAGRFAQYGDYAYLIELAPRSSLGILQELESSNWLDNCTRLAKLQFQVFSRNFNETMHYSVFVETNEANLQYVTTRVTYSIGNKATPTWFIFFVALFLSCIALDLIRTAWFIKQAKFATWTLMWQAISVRNTVLNPLVLLLGVVAAVGNLQVVMAVCNVLATVKLYTYVYVPLPAMQREYWQRISINLSAVLLLMLVCMCAFAWLLVAVIAKEEEDFNQTFMWLAKQLVRGVPPVWWENMPVARVFTVVASQLVINVLLLKICIPICYYAM